MFFAPKVILVATLSTLYAVLIQAEGGLTPYVVPFLSTLLGSLTVIIPQWLRSRRQARLDALNLQTTSTDRWMESTTSERKDLLAALQRQFEQQEAFYEQQREFYEYRQKELRQIIETHRALSEGMLKDLQQSLGKLLDKRESDPSA